LIEIIQRRLAGYKATSAPEENQAIREIVQEVALYALWRADFFAVAAFQGGTSLRILHGMPRFSEDLDFILMTPDAHFAWPRYLQEMTSVLEEFGLQSELVDRTRMDQNIRQAVLKDTSVANQLNLGFFREPTQRLVQVKLEIDVCPPAGSGFEHTYLDFPLDFEVCHQDLASNFALKIHALLCRPFLKGRDWYDFNWYVKQRIRPNLPHLAAAVNQAGPWAGQGVQVDEDWLLSALEDKIRSIDWQAAAQDVERFLNPLERKSLGLWNSRFFESKLAQLVQVA
jgi:predicted nucleotidyltransferase component of viral defense system